MKWVTTIKTEKKINVICHDVRDFDGNYLSYETNEMEIIKHTIVHCDNEKQQKLIFKKMENLYTGLFLSGTMHLDDGISYIIVLNNEEHDKMLDLIKKEILKIEE